MILDYIARLGDPAVLRAHLLAVSEEIAALHAENAALRNRLKALTQALELCRSAAAAGLADREPPGWEDGDP